MNEFYHVSRGNLDEVAEIRLQSIEEILYRFNLPGFYTNEDFFQKMSLTYPNGLSRHGLQYLASSYNIVKDNNGIDYVPYMPIIETTFEFSRLAKFPHLHSRFESFFGCRNLEEAKHLRNNVFRRGEIYKVSCQNYFLADMNLLKCGLSVIGNMHLAEKYWGGENSANAFIEVLMYPPVFVLERVQ